MKDFIVVVLLITLMWLTASWVDVIRQNTEPNPEYQSWNAFVICVNNQAEN